MVSTILSCWATSKTGIQTCILHLFQNMTEHIVTITKQHTNAKQAKHLHLNKPQIQITWTLLILSSCPSLSIIAMLSCSGRPSFSQLRVGGGRPVAVHSSSSTLSTATSCSSGDEEPEIFGGSNMGKYILRFNTYIRFYAFMLLKVLLYGPKNLLQSLMFHSHISFRWQIPRTVRLKVLVLLPAWLLATQL